MDESVWRSMLSPKKSKYHFKGMVPSDTDPVSFVPARLRQAARHRRADLPVVTPETKSVPVSEEFAFIRKQGITLSDI